MTLTLSSRVDYNDPQIDQPPSNGVCNDNYRLCGLRYRKYPDKRSICAFHLIIRLDRKVSRFTDFSNGHDNMIMEGSKHTLFFKSENTAQIGDDSNNTVKL